MSTVLFVCVHNAGRSQMAEAILRHLAKEKGLSIIAMSAGTSGAGELNPFAVVAMREIGIEMGHHRPKMLDQAMVGLADKIISMGCGVDAAACPANFLVTEDWGLDDPAGQTMSKVREIRDEIVERVADLIADARGTRS